MFTCFSTENDMEQDAKAYHTASVTLFYHILGSAVDMDSPRF